MFNVTRSYPAPVSLSNKNGYRQDDVLNELRKIFFDKCYLCEIKEPDSINVEHLKPHGGDEDLMHDWDNLFFVCGRCNNIKLAKYSNILDCTNPDRDAFILIKHLPPHTPYQKKVIIEAMEDDDQVNETVELLREIFNSDKTVNKKITAVYLRKKVFKRYNRVLELANIYFNDESTANTKNEALETLKVLMDKKQEFSAFIRWIVLEDEKLNELIGEYIN
jgi:hypothetical protein